MMLPSFLLFLLLFTTSSWGAPVEQHLIFGLKGQVPDFHPEAVIDIGANKGKYSAFIRRMYPDTSILLVEADKKHESNLEKFCKEKDGVEYKIAVLSETDNVPVNWWGGGDTGNSIFRENSAAYEKDKPVQKMTQTLDQVFANSHIANMSPDIIKIDVQGAELLVLKGGIKTLRKTTFLQLEASTVSLNEGGSCTWQVDEFLRSFGFALFNLGDEMSYPPLFKTTGVGQYDVIYINTNKLPPSLQEAKFCTGVSSSTNNYLQESMVELENLVGMQQSTSCKRGSGGILILVGLLLGYLGAWIQIRLFRVRLLQRED